MDNLFTAIGVIVVCCSVLAWLACRGRQPIIAGYFLAGVLMGPVGFHAVSDPDALRHISRIGVALLLFLAGMVLHPERLRRFFRTAVTVTLAKAALMWILTFALLRGWGFGLHDSCLAALALMFSSTILVVKLLPTTTLHQQRMGSICIAILIAEDLLAVVVLMLAGSVPQTRPGFFVLWLSAKVLLLVVLAIVGEQFVVRRMMQSVERYNEVLIMLCLGWCVGLAVLAEALGVPAAVGAFVAGVAMARGKIALVLAEQLKPLRDFFLMLFFFVLGSTLEPLELRTIWLPTLITVVIIVALRPLWLQWLFRRMGEEAALAREMGVRLGQASEFAMIIAVVAAQSGNMTPRAAQLVQFTAILSMLISSYVVVLKCATPIGVRPAMQRD